MYKIKRIIDLVFVKKKAVKEAGFTLIELGLFLGLAGLLAATALNEYSRYMQQKAISDTAVRKDLVTQALSAFVGNFDRLPCPADPSLTPTDPLAGLEICIASPPPSLMPAISVTAPVVPVNKGNVFRVAGYRDTNVDGDPFNDPALVGSVPYVTLGITHKETMDGWGSTFTYAVSEHMTVLGQYDDNKGVIRKLFRSTTPPIGTIFPELANISPTPTANAFLIALISHGRDKRGGSNYQGNLIAPCDTATPSQDSLNCDLDAEFISADPKTDIYNLVPGTLFFDDAFSVFGINRDGDKWVYTSGSSIENKTGGRVGIGVTAPGVALDVRGNILINNKYKTNEYCDINGSNCFDPEIIGGTSGISCSNGLMTGISNSNVICATKIDPSLLNTGSCPISTYVKGIDSGGNIICAP